MNEDKQFELLGTLVCTWCRLSTAPKRAAARFTTMLQSVVEPRRGRPLGAIDLRGKAVRSNMGRESLEWREFCRDLGETIKATRRDRAVAADELAAAVDAHEQTVMRWERGNGAPGLLALLAASKALGCALIDLLPESARYP